MAYAAVKATKAGLEEPLEQIHKIRITLSSKNVNNLEKGIVFFAHGSRNFVRLRSINKQMNMNKKFRSIS
ncbi:putative ribosomal protein S10 domain superfamily [Helianthus annuus]|nr:putative ribosomal protein S10 [Helianthus annuus]KAJ0921229.1 putative ribosomal protein S10 domain superfamily [Helianthus annuus]